MKLIYLLFSIVNCEKIIKNINIPSCKNCIHFNPTVFSNDFTSSLGKCNNFGNKDIITDKITYDYADLCRSDESKCGNNGIYFEQDKNIEFKILKYIIIGNIPSGFITFFIFLYLIIYTNK
jgi:hypothetical protein